MFTKEPEPRNTDDHDGDLSSDSLVGGSTQDTSVPLTTQHPDSTPVASDEPWLRETYHPDQELGFQPLENYSPALHSVIRFLYYYRDRIFLRQAITRNNWHDLSVTALLERIEIAWVEGLFGESRGEMPVLPLSQLVHTLPKGVLHNSEIQILDHEVYQKLIELLIAAFRQHPDHQGLLNRLRIMSLNESEIETTPVKNLQEFFECLQKLKQEVINPKYDEELAHTVFNLLKAYVRQNVFTKDWWERSKTEWAASDNEASDKKERNVGELKANFHTRATRDLMDSTKIENEPLCATFVSLWLN